MGLIAGIDEAGRGCVIGPLVVAMTGLKKKSLSKLVEIGVKDSKMLTSSKRVLIASSIRRVAEVVEVRRISARNIDRFREKGVGLNEIEAMLIGSIVSKYKGVFYVDSVDRNCERFRKIILKNAPSFKGKLIVRNYLDESNPLVGAASIIAKVERDRAVKKLLNKAGLPKCSGYPGDPNTIKLLREILFSDVGENIVRKSWSTVTRVKTSLTQDKISRFF